MILLFTLSYPFKKGQEYTFISNEVRQLIKHFNYVELIPSISYGDKYELDHILNINCELGEYFSTSKKRFAFIFKSRFYYLFFLELLHKPYLLLSFTKLKRLINYILITILTEVWINEKLVPIISKSDEKVIIYTYWFNHITTALCQVFSTNQNVKIITRAHGIDLFEYRNNNYLPLRNYTIHRLSKFYFVSDCGKEYATKLYPKFKEKFKTFPLGVLPHNLVNPVPKRGIFHIVSCSSVDVNKRLELILDALFLFARHNNEENIRWTHFGEGPLFQKLLDKVHDQNCPNLIIDLKGYQTTESIFDFYNQEAINLFITTTASEGGRPLSVQEALSFGIPVIATKVGGIPELINEENGHLLSANPDVNEIIDVLNNVLFNFDLWNNKRKMCIDTWKEKCNSTKLTDDFIRELESL